MKDHTSTDISAFLATRSITQVPAGEAALPSGRRFWRDAVRSTTPVNARPSTRDIRRVATVDALDRHYIVNADGEWIATE
jgi:hypothetical protein